MKDIFKRISVIVIALIMAIGVFAVSACDSNPNGNKNLVKLEVENAKTQFLVGDTFEYGENFTVWAVYDDDSKANVTSSATISKDLTLDMNVAGVYQITVRYGGLITEYKINVAAFENILKEIKISTTGVKTKYILGEEISFDGIKITCTYQNAQNNLIKEEKTSLKDFTVQIKDPDGNILTDNTLSTLGVYTVTISSGEVKDEYTVTVASDISTVQGAIDAANQFSGEVVSGTSTVDSSMHGTTEVYREFNYTYEFGDNYLNVKEKGSENEELHLSLNSDGSLFCTRILNEEMVPNNYSDADMMNGVSVFLWYQSYTAYGVEAAIAHLYEEGQEATNGDFKMSADPDKREYSFSYTGLHFSFNVNAKDYYETKVTFRLGSEYNIEYAKIEQGYWENNANFGDDGSVVKEPTTFRTDSETGITTPISPVSKNITITVNQTVGKRVKTNPYSAGDFTITSFNLKYNGQILEDGATITTSMANGRSLNIDIENILPTTADFRHDTLYFRLEGSYSDEVNSATMLVENGFMAYRSNNRIIVTFERGGEWTLIMRTNKVEKTVKFSVTGAAPTVINTVIYNSLSKNFYKATEATTMAGTDLIFYGEVNDYANAEQTAAVTSQNADKATIEQISIEGVSCFAFSATESGEYKIKITSLANSAKSCELTVTVVAAPDMEVLLDGKYTATDVEGSVFEVTFTPENTDGKICGRVEITKTPLDDEDNLDHENKVTQVLSYEVKDGTYEIELKSISGENLGALLKIDTSTCDLVIEDQYGLCYKLEKVS